VVRVVKDVQDEWCVSCNGWRPSLFNFVSTTSISYANDQCSVPLAMKLFQPLTIFWLLTKSLLWVISWVAMVEEKILTSEEFSLCLWLASVLLFYFQYSVFVNSICPCFYFYHCFLFYSDLLLLIMFGTFWRCTSQEHALSLHIFQSKRILQNYFILFVLIPHASWHS
jgi:hypothetical protein